MSDALFWSICASIGLVIVLLKYGPSRGDLWGAVENWGGDNRVAAKVRERRRAQRKALKRREAEWNRLIAAEESAVSGKSARLETGRQSR